MDGHYSGTPPQGFVRPDGDASMKMAVIYSGEQLHIQVLDNSFTFDGALDQNTVDAWLAGNSSAPMGGVGARKGLGGAAVPSAAPPYPADMPVASFDVILG